MKTYLVGFRATAEADLDGLYQYIAKRSGIAVADGYLDRLEAFCLSLAEFPERGAPREDIGPGARVLSFERRVAIAYRLRGRRISIYRIAYGGRDYALMMQQTPRH